MMLVARTLRPACAFERVLCLTRRARHWRIVQAFGEMMAAVLPDVTSLFTRLAVTDEEKAEELFQQLMGLRVVQVGMMMIMMMMMTRSTVVIVMT
jgi:hypothetical protein